MNGFSPDALKEALAAVGACVHCGSCLPVCPAFKVSHREELGPRGKLRLLTALDEGRLSPGREVGDLLRRCLLCGRCAKACPNQVPVAQGLAAGRALLAQAAGSPLKKPRILAKALPGTISGRGLARAGRLARPLIRWGIPLSSGLHLRLAGLEGLHKLPPMAARPFLAESPHLVPGPQGAPRLGLFVGCVANYLRPELARRAMALLSRRFTVVIPPGQGCCGLPGMAAGLLPGVEELFNRQVALFSAAKVDLIVTTCASCAFALGRELPRLLQTPAAASFGACVREISQVLAEETKLLAGRGAGAGPVALHEPCNLKVGLGVSEEPRTMLAAAGVETAAMEEADACCGGGGLLPLNDPKLSRAVFEPAAQAFARSGARVLATSCSGCYLQWRRGLGIEIPVVHPIELLSTES